MFWPMPWNASIMQRNVENVKFCCVHAQKSSSNFWLSWWNMDTLANSKSSTIIVLVKLSSILPAVSTNAVSSHQDSMFQLMTSKNGQTTFCHHVNSGKLSIKKSDKVSITSIPIGNLTMNLWTFIQIFIPKLAKTINNSMPNLTSKSHIQFWFIPVFFLSFSVMLFWPLAAELWITKKPDENISEAKSSVSSFKKTTKQ